MHRFTKLSFILAVALLISPLALNAQAKASKWNGIHVGVIGGTDAGNFTLQDDSGGGDSFKSSLAGGQIGIQAGIDHNFHGFVLGAVADWSFTNSRFKLDDFISSGTTIRDTVKQAATFRVRAGKHYHQVLPYVHAGVLIADTKLEEDGGGTSDVLENGIHPGFVVGAGMEYFVAKNYSFSTEYGFNLINGANIPGEDASAHIHYNALVVGVHYHF